MTPLERVLRTAVAAILDAKWNFRVGRVVPSPLDIALSGGAVELDCTVLYSDLADSSGLATEVDRRVASKAVKSFLTCACRLIRAHRGQVVSFDGDRVMGIFVGERMNSRAAMTALKLNYVVRNIISPRLIRRFESLSEAGFVLRHATGIDTGIALAVRTGLRAANDTIWVGRAPNLAAKLSGLRSHPHATFITAAVYNSMADDVKYTNGEAMWERRNLAWQDETIHIYRSPWTRTP